MLETCLKSGYPREPHQVLMVEIIPSINALTFSEVQEKITKVEPYVSWCHLDVTDGVFSTHATWNKPSDLVQLQTRLSVEVHLMVQNPERVLEEWLVKPIKRIIVHLEAVKDMSFILEKCQKAEIEIGMSIRPDTHWDKFIPYFNKINYISVLAVSPGPSGQKMAENTFNKVKNLKENCPSCLIEVDGGVNINNIASAAQEGAGVLVVGSAIFDSPDAGKEINKLKQRCTQ